MQSVWLNCSDAIWKLLGHQVEAPYEIIDSVYLEVSSFQLCFMFIWIGSRSSPKRTRWFPPRLRRPCGFSWWQICANFHFLGTPIYTRTGGEHDDEAAVVLMIIYNIIYTYIIYIIICNTCIQPPVIKGSNEQFPSINGCFFAGKPSTNRQNFHCHIWWLGGY